jgi:glutathione S-transferase
MIADTFDEIGAPLSEIRFRTKDEADKAEKTKKFLEETLPLKLRALENLVQGKFFLGEKESLADIQLFDVVVNKLQAKIPTASIDAYPKLSSIVANVKALPAIAAYLAK